MAARTTKRTVKARAPKATPGVSVGVRRGELDDPNFSRGIHTAYLADEASGMTDAGNTKRHRTQDFYRGRNDAVPSETLAQLRKEGICR